MLENRFIVILAMPRSGTHFLRSAMAKGMGVVNLDEPFNPDLTRKLDFSFSRFLRRKIRVTPEWRFDAETADRVLDGYFEELSRVAPDKTLLLDIKDGQLRALDWPNTNVVRAPRLLSYIFRNRFPIIRVTRRDLLAQYVSFELAVQSGRWVSTQEQGKRLREVSSLRINANEALRHMRSTALADAAMSRWLADYPRLAPIVYEEMIDGRHLSEATAARIAQLTGLAIDRHVEAEPSKLAPPLRELVSNLDEILDLLKGTKLSWIGDLHRDGDRP